MQRFKVLLLLAVIFFAQGICKPHKNADSEYYADDDYNEDDDDPEPNTAEGTPGEPPHIRSKAINLRVKLGSTVEFPCVVENAEDNAVAWLKNGAHYLYLDDTIIATEEKDRITRLENNSLRIANVSDADAADYTCVILLKNNISITHTLRIKNEQPESMDTNKGPLRYYPSDYVVIRQRENVTLGCQIIDSNMEPKPKMKWSREGKRLHTSDEAEFYTIHNASRHDAGRYQCLAENGMSKPLSGAIVLDVTYAPEIDVDREYVHTGLGMTVELTCVVHANPRANVTWFTKQRQVVAKKGKSFKESKSHTRHSLIINHVIKHDLGEYTCVAKNELGEFNNTIYLTGAPTSPVVYAGDLADDDTTYILKWSLESFSPVLEYELTYRYQGEDWQVAKPRVTASKGSKYTVEHPIQGLRPGSYEAILMARNEFGWSPRPAPYTFKTDYKPEEVKDEGVPPSSAPSVHLLTSFTTLLLVVSSCAFISL